MRAKQGLMKSLHENSGRLARLSAILKGKDTATLRTIAGLLLAIIALSAVFWISANLIGLDENGILATTFRAFVDSPFALPVAILSFTLASFIGAPQFLLIAVAVAAFGPLTGFLYSILSTLVSASVNFLLARYFGIDWLRRRGWRGLARISGMVGRNGFMAALLVRIIPSAPFIVVNMGLGLSDMTYRAFIAGTAIGILPKTAVIALLGKVIERAQAGNIEAIQYLVLAALAWLALAFATKSIARRRGPNRQSEP